MLSFTVVADEHGKPMAVDLAEAHDRKGKGKGKASRREVPEYHEAPGLTGRRYQAPVKSYNREKKYGFLLSQDEELTAQFGKPDIFVHGSQLHALGELQV